MTLAYLQGIKHSYLRTIALTDQLAFTNLQLDSDVKERSLLQKNWCKPITAKMNSWSSWRMNCAIHWLSSSASSELLSRESGDETLVKKTTSVLAR